jgi:hypothetical protein
MKFYLHYIRGIPRLEEYVDRKLICASEILKSEQIEEDLVVHLFTDREQVDSLLALVPHKTYAITCDFENGQPEERKYYTVHGFEIREVVDEEDSEKTWLKLTLYTSLFE